MFNFYVIISEPQIHYFSSFYDIRPRCGRLCWLCVASSLWSVLLPSPSWLEESHLMVVWDCSVILSHSGETKRRSSAKSALDICSPFLSQTGLPAFSLVRAVPTVSSFPAVPQSPRLSQAPLSPLPPVEDDLPARYNFGYSVADLESGDSKSRQESREGGKGENLCISSNSWPLFNGKIL